MNRRREQAQEQESAMNEEVSHLEGQFWEVQKKKGLLPRDYWPADELVNVLRVFLGSAFRAGVAFENRRRKGEL